MNYEDEEDGQFHQMVKAKDIAEHVDLNDVSPMKAGGPTRGSSEKTEQRKSAEAAYLAGALKRAQTPGRNQLRSGESPRTDNPSLYDDIKKRGIQEPLHIGVGNNTASLWNGHHRLAAQLHIDPEAEVPVKIHE